MASIEERLQQKVISNPNGCLEFFGAKDGFGYGKLSIGKNKWDRAHRIAWRIKNGDIPVGMCVLHKCDNPACININHLFLGTKNDNNKDKARKGRCNKKLTFEQVKQIRESNGLILEIANNFNVSVSMISQIKNFKVRK